MERRFLPKRYWLESNKKKMRIISGKLKGRTINFLKNEKTRPLKDSVKENIFNILIHSNIFSIEIPKSKILDMYSGVGSFGIEGISRGAEKVIFVEQDLSAVNTLKKNLSKLSIKNNAEIYNSKTNDFLSKNIKDKFNIFFFDPPYADLNLVNDLKLIKDKKIYEINHVAIIHREKKTLDDFKESLKIIETKEYGRSKIIFGRFI